MVLLYLPSRWPAMAKALTMHMYSLKTKKLPLVQLKVKMVQNGKDVNYLQLSTRNIVKIEINNLRTIYIAKIFLLAITKTI